MVSCSWYMVLQILFRLFILWSHRLAVKWTAKLVIRLGIALIERTESMDSVADQLRAEPPRGAGIGRASPAFCPAQQRRARASHYHPQRPPDPSHAPFFFSSAPPSSLRATAAATAAQARRHRHYRHRLAPPRPFATVATPLPSPSLTAPACAHQQRPVSRRAAYDLAGASPRAPSPWPEHHLHLSMR